jgi:hypothetical protein
MYLLRKNGGVAHYWNGVDTVCKMYSTSNMRKKKYTVSATNLGRRVCSMCKVNNKKLLNKFVDKEYEQAKEEFVVQLPML